MLATMKKPICEVTEAMLEWLDYFMWKPNESKVFIPNEIFRDLTQSNLFKNGGKKNFRHRAFAYTYYYLISYLFRNCKYKAIDPIDKVFSITLIEKLYGDRKPINYITKRGGLLDEMGYTSSENNFPVDVILRDGQLEDFEMYQDLLENEKEIYKVPSGFICKYPTKGFYRYSDDEIYTGTFFAEHSTHAPHFTIFAKCMSEDSKGYNGYELFYVYAFLYAFEKFFMNKEIFYKAYIPVALGTTNEKITKIISKLAELGLLVYEEKPYFKYQTRRKIKISQK